MGQSVKLKPGSPPHDAPGGHGSTCVAGQKPPGGHGRYSKRAPPDDQSWPLSETSSETAPSRAARPLSAAENGGAVQTSVELVTKVALAWPVPKRHASVLVLTKPEPCTRIGVTVARSATAGRARSTRCSVTNEKTTPVVERARPSATSSRATSATVCGGDAHSTRSSSTQRAGTSRPPKAHCRSSGQARPETCSVTSVPPAVPPRGGVADQIVSSAYSYGSALVVKSCAFELTSSETTRWLCAGTSHSTAVALRKSAADTAWPKRQRSSCSNPGAGRRNP